MLHVKNLCYCPRNLRILHQINLDLILGEVLMVIGPNGAGKSTLLSFLANENIPDRGKIIFKGKNLNEWDQGNLARYKAKFSQEHQADIGLAVKDIVLMGRYPYFHSQPHKKDLEIVLKKMQMMEVNHLRDTHYNLLSGGEKQRVHLARVFSQLENDQPGKLAFFDEPLNNLDVRHQYRILEQIQSFVKTGNSAIVVLHDLNLAAQFAGRVVLMRKGEILAHGKPEEIFKERWITKAYDFPCCIMSNPLTHTPMILFGN